CQWLSGCKSVRRTGVWNARRWSAHGGVRLAAYVHRVRLRIALVALAMAANARRRAIPRAARNAGRSVDTDDSPPPRGLGYVLRAFLSGVLVLSGAELAACVPRQSARAFDDGDGAGRCGRLPDVCIRIRPERLGFGQMARGRCEH